MWQAIISICYVYCINKRILSIGTLMQIRQLWHYALGIICAIFFNGLLILLLILASPRKTQPPENKTISHSNWLKLSLSEKTEQQTTKKTETNDLLITKKTYSQERNLITEKNDLETKSNNIPDSLETTIFFQKGQEMLHELNMQKLTSNESTRSKAPLEIINLDPVQFYYRKAVNHINAYRQTLRKKYATLRMARQERLERQPELFVVINKDGSLLNVFLEKSSGSPTYDKFCMQAIKQAAPLPKIPNHLKLEHLTLPL